MTIAVDLGRKATKQTNKYSRKQISCLGNIYIHHRKGVRNVYRKWGGGGGGEEHLHQENWKLTIFPYAKAKLVQ